MTLKQPKQIITSIFNKYVKKQDNIVFANKLFIINSIINNLFKNKQNKTFNQDLIEYGEIINRYLENQIDIFWKDGRIMIKELDQVDRKFNGG